MPTSEERRQQAEKGIDLEELAEEIGDFLPASGDKSEKITTRKQYLEQLLKLLNTFVTKKIFTPEKASDIYYFASIATPDPASGLAEVQLKDLPYFDVLEDLSELGVQKRKALVENISFRLGREKIAADESIRQSYIQQQAILAGEAAKERAFKARIATFDDVLKGRREELVPGVETPQVTRADYAGALEGLTPAARQYYGGQFGQFASEYEGLYGEWWQTLAEPRRLVELKSFEDKAKAASNAAKRLYEIAPEVYEGIATTLPPDANTPEAFADTWANQGGKSAYSGLEDLVIGNLEARARTLNKFAPRVPDWEGRDSRQLEPLLGGNQYRRSLVGEYREPRPGRPRDYLEERERPEQPPSFSQYLQDYPFLAEFESKTPRERGFSSRRFRPPTRFY